VPRKAFRLKTNGKSYAKREEERKALAEMKARENAMKEEKEAERQVSITAGTKWTAVADTFITATNTSYQGQEGS